MDLEDTILEIRSLAAGERPVPRATRVFILDDNRAAVDMILHALKESPLREFDCTVARDLADALWQVDDVNPHVVLMALELSDGRGVYAFQKLRQMLPNASFVVYCEIDEPNLGEALIREGAQDYVSTGMIAVPGILARTIQHAVQRERSRRALREASLELSHQRGKLERTAEELHEAQLSLVDAERMRTIGRLAAGVAHEVKNPLAVVQAGVDFLRGRLGDERVTERTVLDKIEKAVKRADTTIRGLLDFAAPKALVMSGEDLKFMVLESFNLTEHALIKHHVDFTMDLPPDLPSIHCDHDKCVQVLVNLILNACHAIKSNGQIIARASVRRLEELQPDVRDPEARAVQLNIEDNGPGIPEHILPQLFQPFFTTKDKEGTGLGLCVARMIMHMHGGDLVAENRSRGGARFRMYWPLNVKPEGR